MTRAIRLAIVGVVVASVAVVGKAAAGPPAKWDLLPSWSPNGDLAYAHREYREEWIAIRDRDGATRKLLQIGPDPYCCAQGLDYSPDGRTLALKANFKLYLIDVATARVRRAGPADQFDWAPNSRSLVVRPFYDGGSPLRIVRRSDRKVVRRLPDGSSPRWSPNGRTIAYEASRRRGAGTSVYAISAGGGLPRVVVRGGSPMAWSPDGRQILYVGTVNGRHGSWIVAARGGTPRRIALSFGKGFWSPDGKHVALWDTDTRIQIVTSRGKFVRRLSGRSPVWSPDGRGIAFMPSYGTCSYPGIHRADLPRRTPVRLTGNC